jgi:HAD superfamily hydrolase (TIGR01549 family)
MRLYDKHPHHKRQQKMSRQIKAVVLDAFGTTVQTVPRSGIYYQVLSKAENYRDARFRALTENVDLPMLAQNLGLPEIDPSDLSKLYNEASDLHLYEDTIEFVERCKTDGMKIGICSNLAYHYGTKVKSLLPLVDQFTFSFEVGAIKPQRQIYEAVCNGLNVLPQQVAFIGDTPLADKYGPDAFGMRGVHLKRREGDTLASALNRAFAA